MSMCDAVEDWPGYLGPVGGLVDNVPLVCGGENDKNCYNYVGNEWKEASFNMNVARRLAAGAVIGSSEFLVAGGRGFDGAELSSMELYSSFT